MPIMPSNPAAADMLEVTARECTLLEDPLRIGRIPVVWAGGGEPNPWERGNSKFREYQPFVVFVARNKTPKTITVREFLLRDDRGRHLPFLEVPKLDREINPWDTFVLAFRKEKLAWLLRDVYLRPNPFKGKPVFRCHGDPDLTGHTSVDFFKLDLTPPSSPMEDPELVYHHDVFADRARRISNQHRRLAHQRGGLAEYADCDRVRGFHRRESGEWAFTEWAPNARKIYLVGDFSDWREDEAFALRPIELPNEPAGTWQVVLPPSAIRHGQNYKLKMYWEGGGEDRMPSCARWVVQDWYTRWWTAQVWDPPEPYRFQHDANRKRPAFPLIYESHVGIATEEEKIGSFVEFRDRMLPRIRDAGYNMVQLMGVLEHPLYASFGYQVSNYFAVSSRFGTPDDFKSLVDEAHRLGLVVVIDLVHSHAVKNHIEGLSCFDGTEYQYFHAGDRGNHRIWDSRCFDYGKPEVVRFLLSNCRFWLEEYHVDGFRFDAVTSMLYKDHGIAVEFTRIEQYFPYPGGYNPIDEDAVTYLGLANKLIHEVNPQAMVIAEDSSGFPGLTSPIKGGGVGFDYRFAMGVPDYWIKAVKLQPDHWDMGKMWYELTRRRGYEQTISYPECHDQSIVGDKPIAFAIMDAAMYHHMSQYDPDHAVMQGVALHKMIRLVTLATADRGYLNFMGNEFGHPEWLDFPRDGNGQSFKYARRRWSLRDNRDLKYFGLAEFDRAMFGAFMYDPSDAAASLRLGLNDFAKKLLTFERGNLLFIFNFHPRDSYPDYPMPASPGSYDRVLNSDEGWFAGRGILREDTGKEHHTYRAGGADDSPRYELKVYIPSLTALVLRKRK